MLGIKTIAYTIGTTIILTRQMRLKGKREIHHFSSSFKKQSGNLILMNISEIDSRYQNCEIVCILVCFNHLDCLYVCSTGEKLRIGLNNN